MVPPHGRASVKGLEPRAAARHKRTTKIRAMILSLPIFYQKFDSRRPQVHDFAEASPTVAFARLAATASQFLGKNDGK